MNDETNEQRRAVLWRPLDTEPFEPRSAAFALELGAASVAGKTRTENADHFVALRFTRAQDTVLTSLGAADLPERFEEHGYAILIANGLGENATGARASRVVLSALAHLAIRYGRWHVRVDAETLIDIHEQGQFFYRQANDAVAQARRATPELLDMATSLTALYVADGELFFAHVGHSKAFLFREGALIQLTTSHTLSDRPGAAGPLTLGRAKRDGHVVVTDTVGGWPMAPDVEIEHCQLASGDRLLL